MSKRTVISSVQAPAAIGPYSQAIRVGNLLFCSGQLGLDPATGDLREGIDAQATQAVSNVVAVLAAAGATPAQVAKTTIFLTDLAHFATVNKIYAEVFNHEPPARSTIQVAALPKGGLVEVEVIAVFED